MQLMMYIGNDLIEAVTLNDASIPKPGYVGNFKRRLKMKYEELIRQYSSPPEFLVSNPLPQTSNQTSIPIDPSKRG
jgi:hypothetical protein